METYQSHIEFSFRCPAGGLNISASLCWKLHKRLCIPVLNSTLQKREGNILVNSAAVRRILTIYLKRFDLMSFTVEQEFNTQTVDKHPQMCVQVRESDGCVSTEMSHFAFFILIIYLITVLQFSLQGSSNISCLFEDGESLSFCLHKNLNECFHCLTYFFIWCSYRKNNLENVYWSRQTEPCGASYLHCASKLLSPTLCPCREGMHAWGRNSLANSGLYENAAHANKPVGQSPNIFVLVKF